VSLALIEVEHPEFAADCQSARAYSYYQRAVALIQKGDATEAREAIRTALRYDPTVSWKVPVWWLVSHLPNALARAIEQRRAR
jgi:Tfp pilus assembly protein PilF